MDEATLGQAVQQSMKIELPCVLCGQATRSRGVFMPDSRVRIYALCDEHSQDAGTVELIESVLRKQGLGRGE